MNEKYFGEVSGLSNEKYHASKALGSTTLKYGIKSLAHLKAVIDGRVKKKESSAFDVGKSAHAAILEKSFGGYIQGPQVSSKAVKAWKEFVAEHSDKTVLTPDEYDSVRGMYDVFHAHPLAPKLIANGIAESSFFVEDKQTGLYLKARPDFYIRDDEKGDVIVDYKTATCALYEDFAKAIYNYGYDFSAVHYIRVVEQITGRSIKDFIWIVQEKEAPYAIQIFTADTSCLERVERKHSRLLDQIAAAQQNNVWPGYNEMIQEIDIPAWAISKEIQNEQFDEIA